MDEKVVNETDTDNTKSLISIQFGINLIIGTADKGRIWELSPILIDSSWIFLNTTWLLFEFVLSSHTDGADKTLM